MKNLKIKNSAEGITLVEIIVTVFLIAVLSSILIADFPAILRQFALSRAAYKLSQEMRKAEDLGLSGVQVTDNLGAPVSAKGYGIYLSRTTQIDISIPAAKQYTLYADVDNSKTYNASQSCDLPGRNTSLDCAIETIDISKEEPGVYIKAIIYTTDPNSVSVNFTPPNPDITITALSGGSEVNIVLGLDADPSLSKTVSINTSGLIEVK